MDKLSILKVGTSEFEIADAEARGTLLTKADVDGAYPKLVAGDIVETEVKDDVFTYQVTDHTGEANINSIKGNTIVWNQLINISVQTSTANGITYTINGDGSISISGTATATADKVIATNVPYISGHKYLLTGGQSSDLSSNVNAPNNWKNSIRTDRANGTIIECINSYAGTIFLSVTNGATVNTKIAPMLIDLTAMGLDSLTVAEFKALFPSYYSYESGKLLSFNGTGIKVTGKNLLSKGFKQGTINGSTGVEQSSTTRLCTTGFIYLNKGDYVIHNFNTNDLYFAFDVYDLNEVFDATLSASFNAWTRSTKTFSLEHPVLIKLLVRFGNNATIIPTDATQVMIEHSSTPTEYEIYTESTLSLPIAQYFPNGMKSAGNAHDELTPTKVTTRLIKTTVDGTNTVANYYGAFQGHQLFYVDLFSTTSTSSADLGALKSNHYMTATNATMDDKCIRYQIADNIPNIGRIYWNDDRYTSASAMNTALQSDPLEIISLAQTPTEVDVDLDLSYNTYEGGTEQLLPVNTDVPVTSPISMNVEFDFNENLNANLIKMLNCVAHVETSPSANNYAVGSYLMYNYQLYKVTSAITTGEALVEGTNITATTVMAELLALNS